MTSDSISLPPGFVLLLLSGSSYLLPPAIPYSSSFFTSLLPYIPYSIHFLFSGCPFHSSGVEDFSASSLPSTTSLDSSDSSDSSECKCQGTPLIDHWQILPYLPACRLNVLYPKSNPKPTRMLLLQEFQCRLPHVAAF